MNLNLRTSSQQFLALKKTMFSTGLMKARHYITSHNREDIWIKKKQEDPSKVHEEEPHMPYDHKPTFRNDQKEETKKGLKHFQHF